MLLVIIVTKFLLSCSTVGSSCTLFKTLGNLIWFLSHFKCTNDLYCSYNKVEYRLNFYFLKGNLYSNVIIFYRAFMLTNVQLLISAQYYCSNISFSHINGFMISEMIYSQLKMYPVRLNVVKVSRFSTGKNEVCK